MKTIKVSSDVMQAVRVASVIAVPCRNGDEIDDKGRYAGEAIYTKTGALKFERYSVVNLTSPTESFLASILSFKKVTANDLNTDTPKSIKAKEYWLLRLFVAPTEVQA